MKIRDVAKEYRSLGTEPIPTDSQGESVPTSYHGKEPNPANKNKVGSGFFSGVSSQQLDLVNTLDSPL